MATEINYDIVDRLRQGSDGCTCGSFSYDECSCEDASWSVMYLDEAANEIQKLRLLIKQLLPFMLNDMEEGLHLGYSENHDHEEEPCADCIWFKEASYWKRRLDAGHFKEYGL